MKASVKRFSALFFSLTLLSVTLATLGSSAASAESGCPSVCTFRFDQPRDSATGNQEVGLQFQSDTAGFIAGICFWVAATETGTHTVQLWDDTGTSLASATSVVAETPGQESCIDFPAPPAIDANTTYTASYTANVAFGVQKNQFFRTVDSPPLHAPVGAGVTGDAGSAPTTVPKYDDGYGVDVAYISSLGALPFDCTSTLTAPSALSSQPGSTPGRGLYAVVSWAPATSDPPGCIAGYVVTSYIDGTAVRQTLLPGDPTTWIIFDLPAGASYTFTVQAESGRLAGPASDMSEAITIGAPTEPTSASVSHASKGAVRVGFRASASNGSAITKYTATCKAPGGATRSASGKHSPLVVKHLTRGHKYTCTVRATNHRGNGRSSRASGAIKA